MGDFAVPAPKEPKRKKAKIRNLHLLKAKKVAERLQAEKEKKPELKLLDDDSYYDGKYLEKWFEMWKMCPRFGRPVRGTRFIALKTPLATWYEIHLKSSDIFTIDMFVERFTVKNKEPIGLFANATWDVDLINYNDKQVYDEWDIQTLTIPVHKSQKQKLIQNQEKASQSGTETESTYVYTTPKENEKLLASRFQPPTDQQVKDFIQKVKQVWSEDPLQLVAVCSSFGYNRAGVLITSFLVEELKIPVDSAIHRFAQSRPPGIYSKPCLKFLHKKYGGHMTVPPAPAWDKEAAELGVASIKSENKEPQVLLKGEDHASTSASSKLPEPWVRQFSNRMKREYYYNPVTNKSIWDIKDISN
eukprot:CAMPEP_0204830136 /NCGR_PEP_ID=MMETSP1346-20131115/8357_1 /ASSEMBLY_ACC=CAM_ASM_000771 /TAXON_ID=215587 /ORGANISM="Aplanochytrium stocchinoi, Strain GSBS06" /LENGTH=358 /DNA_ID=CAMNT_0051960277 /DNA_START=47 /DNA_END=1124 /DNA_ORIENTATION=-